MLPCSIFPFGFTLSVVWGHPNGCEWGAGIISIRCSETPEIWELWLSDPEDFYDFQSLCSSKTHVSFWCTTEQAHLQAELSYISFCDFLIIWNITVGWSSNEFILNTQIYLVDC